jgi:hypothetical protein
MNAANKREARRKRAKIVGLAVVGMLGIGALVQAQSPEFTPLPAGASVRIVEPADRASLVSPVKVVFSVSGAQIKPAGQPEAGTGHHHLLIDTDATPVGVIVAADATHLHFGKGQTEAMVQLSPGRHSLTLQFADGLHRSYGPALSHTIHITVTEY